MSVETERKSIQDRLNRVFDDSGILSRGRVLGILSLVGGFIIWEISARSISGVLLAPPTYVFEALWELIITGTLTSALIGTLIPMFIGYFISIGLALPLGFLIAQSKQALWALNPYIDMTYTAPTIVYLPLIIVWFGIGFQARVFYVILFCFFEILIDTYSGIAAVSEEYSDVTRSFDASWWQGQRLVMLPASMPFIFAGLRLGMGRAVRGIIVAEIFLRVVNMGAILRNATALLDTSVQLAAVIVIALMGIVLQKSLRVIERRAIPWHFARGEH